VRVEAGREKGSRSQALGKSFAPFEHTSKKSQSFDKASSDVSLKMRKLSPVNHLEISAAILSLV